MKTAANVLSVRLFGITLIAVIGFFFGSCKQSTGPSKPTAVTGVSLNKAALTMTVGDTESLSAVVEPEEAANKALTWASGNTDVAAVSDGTVSAKAPGTAAITVTTADGGFTASCAVTVRSAGAVAVTGVTLNQDTLILAAGDSEQLSAAVQPANATNKKLTWASGNTNVATVSDDGILSALAPGNAAITATTEDGGFTASCAVTVTAPVSGVSLNKSALSLTAGDVEQLIPTVQPAETANKNVSWSSSDSTIAAVAEDGTVSARAAGNATITVTTVNGGFTASCAVTVLKKDVSFTINFGGSADIDLPVSGLPLNVSQSDARWPTLRVDNPERYSDIDWHINGQHRKGESFTLNPADVAYNSLGEHALMVEVIHNGVPYSRTITFTVTN